jgi:predicted DCC family thiol-disulfide oxidoreductase YuxK
MTANLLLLYDGQCPLCSAYVRAARLNAQFNVELRDARLFPELVRKYSALGLPVDDGMIVDIDGTTYYGAEAMRVLAELSTASDAWNGVASWMFSSERRARLIYPVLSRGRLLLLWVLGRSKIENRA